MKKRILKIGMSLILVAVVVVAGVYPITSQAAAKGTTYNVTLVKGSANVAVVSINDGTGAATGASMEGTTFQLIVGTKLLTEKKVKSTGQSATYYEVTLPKKSFNAPVTKYPMMSGEGTAMVYTFLKSDGKGKLYVSGGDVDFTAIQGEKKTTVKIGDGKADPEGSLFLTMTQEMPMKLEGTGKLLSKVTQVVNLTTGTCSLTVQNVKGGLNGKSLPADGKSNKTLPDPFTGQVVDLDAGTGTLLTLAASMNSKNAMVGGMVDSITAQVWVMQITKK